MSEISSVGSLGLQVRSDERAYNNYPQVVTEENIGGFIGDTLALSSRPNQLLQTDVLITRTVMRAVVDWPTIRGAVEHGMLSSPEVVTPLPTG